MRVCSVSYQVDTVAPGAMAQPRFRKDASSRKLTGSDDDETAPAAVCTLLTENFPVSGTVGVDDEVDREVAALSLDRMIDIL